MPIESKFIAGSVNVDNLVIPYDCLTTDGIPNAAKLVSNVALYPVEVFPICTCGAAMFTDPGLPDAIVHSG